MTEILVVDDSEFDHEFVRQMFKGINRIRKWNAEYVSSGKAALDRLQERRFDVILTDIHMPEMSGLDLLKRIKLLDIDTPVVVMTAAGNEETVLEALRGGAWDYVIKRKLERELPRVIENLSHRKTS